MPIEGEADRGRGRSRRGRHHGGELQRLEAASGVRTVGERELAELVGRGAVLVDCRTRGSFDVTAASSYREAVAGADLVCATTHPGGEPAVQRQWVEAGTHVTSVGWSPSGREVDDATVADALVCVESRGAALAPVSAAGTPDLAEPRSRGLLDEDGVVEPGELVAGERKGRTSAEQITLYKSVGVAVQDATAASLVLEAARRAGAGRELPL